MNKITRLLILFFILNVAKLSYSQTAASAIIIGSIKDKETGMPLNYASVTLRSVADTNKIIITSSDANGQYLLKSSIIGNFTLIVSNIGYEILKQPVTIRSLNDTIIINILIKADIKRLNEVLITGKLNLFAHKDGKLIVNVATNPIVSSLSLINILKTVPIINIGINDELSINGKYGTKIYIDGHPAFTDDLSLLKSINAGSIDKIEVISNPSSKYDSEGTGGIINIILKKSKKDGITNEFTNSFTLSSYFSYSISDNLSYVTDGLNIYSNVSYIYNDNYQKVLSNRSIYTNNINFNQSIFQKIKNKTPLIRLGFTYNLSEKSSIDCSVQGLYVNENISQNNQTILNTLPSLIDTIYINNPITKNALQKLSLNFNYQLKIDTLGQIISVSGTNTKAINNSKTDLPTLYYNGNNIEIKPHDIITSSTPYNIDIYAFMIDYVNPMTKKLKLETGFKTGFTNSTDNSKYFYYFNNSPILDINKSFTFKYNENISAVYASIDLTINKLFSVNGGVRLERTSYVSNLVSSTLSQRKNYYDIFPNININYDPTTTNSLSVTFSKRIDRPNYKDLNPFIFYIDNFNTLEGNPNLQPQITYSYELNYTYNGSYNLNLFHSKTQNVILQIPLRNNLGTTIISENLKSYSTLGGSVSAPVTIASFWKLDNFFSAFYSKYNSNIDNNFLYTEKLSFKISSTNTITISKNLNVQLSGTYNSPTVQGIYKTSNIYWLTGGIQKSFDKSGFIIDVSVDDFLNNYKEVDNSTFEGQTIHSVSTRNSQSFALTLTYKFHRGKSSTKRKYQNPAEEQLQRI